MEIYIRKKLNKEGHRKLRIWFSGASVLSEATIHCLVNKFWAAGSLLKELRANTGLFYHTKHYTAPWLDHLHENLYDGCPRKPMYQSHLCTDHIFVINSVKQWVFSSNFLTRSWIFNIMSESKRQLQEPALTCTKSYNIKQTVNIYFVRMFYILSATHHSQDSAVPISCPGTRDFSLLQKCWDALEPIWPPTQCVKGSIPGGKAAGESSWLFTYI